MIRHLQKYSDPAGRREIARQDLVQLFSDTGFFLKDFLRIPDITKVFKKQNLWVVQSLVAQLKNTELDAVFDKYWR